VIFGSVGKITDLCENKPQSQTPKNQRIMKKLLLIFAVAVAAACTKVPQGGEEPEIDPNAPTSFVFEQTIDNLLPNCVVGYFDEEGFCWKLADLGDLQYKGQQSKEVIVEDELITEVYFFNDYMTPRVLRRSFPIIKNIKNVFELREDDYANEVNKDNPKEYPQNKTVE
jgi:hypothetical protein